MLKIYLAIPFRSAHSFPSRDATAATTSSVVPNLVFGITIPGIPIFVRYNKRKALASRESA